MISAVYAMSPKSMTPVMNPSSSVSVLSTVRSVCATCARSRGHTGVTRASNASSTRSTTSRPSPTQLNISRASSACWTSQAIRRTAFGCVKPRSATPSRAVVAPHSRNAASDKAVASIRLFPGSTS